MVAPREAEDIYWSSMAKQAGLRAHFVGLRKAALLKVMV